MKIFTIGHSTHSQEEFLSLLKEHKIKRLVDVRSYPGSNYVPIYNKETMSLWLKEAGIDYVHLPKLGGRRKKDKGLDPKLIEGWTHSAFRNYAAYTFTKSYKEGIKNLIKLAQEKRTVMMCSEAVPWRCHRLLVSNTLVNQGIKLEHIINKGKTTDHYLGLYGADPSVKNGEVVYPKKELE